MSLLINYQYDYQLSSGRPLRVRRATGDDSKQVIKVWNSVVKEKKYTMGLDLLREEEEKEFIKSLDKREAIMVGVLESKIVGYLILTIPDKVCRSTLHVAEVGTFVLKKYRGLGIGNYLLISAFGFARRNNFEKMIIKVRSGNHRALSFYQNHGFYKVGRLKREIKINGKYEDHVLMEKFI